MDVRAEMVANVWHVSVAVGGVVSAGDEMFVVESMKMEIPIAAPIAGTVAAIHVSAGDVVHEGDLLAEIAQ